MEYTTIRLDKKTVERINENAKKSETQDQFINRLLDHYEKTKETKP